jgi:small subunit ribosomal protein S6
MRKYECTYILDPGLADEQQEPIIDRFKTLVGDNGGTVEAVDKWERRRLAYEVKGKREGVYVVMNFSGEPQTEAELGRVLGISEGILRHLIVRTDQK